MIGLCLLWDLGVGSLLFLPQYDAIFVMGESMMPTINQGDLVIIKTSVKEIKPGMLIAYTTENE